MNTDPFVLSDVSPRIVERFVDYHRENPAVYDQFKRFAFQLKEAGRDHFGAKAIAERIRFETAVRGNDDFKLNNNFVSCMVRILCWEHPEFCGFFETRTRRAA